jgi:GNAT superfamily N-acetyltransferase
MYRFDLTKPIPEVQDAAPVEMCRATRAEVEEAAALVENRRQVFLTRLDAGLACFVAKVNGRVVAYNWTQYASGDDFGKYVELAPGEILTLDAFTAEEFRGRKIHTVTLAYMLAFAQAQGYRVAYTKVSVLNRRSRKGVRRVTWRLTGLLLLLYLPRGRCLVLPLAGSARPIVPGLGRPAASS